MPQEHISVTTGANTTTPVDTAPNQSKLSVKDLLSSKNPALARLAVEVEKRENGDSAVNYSRMHHRHNRS